MYAFRARTDRLRETAKKSVLDQRSGMHKSSCLAHLHNNRDSNVSVCVRGERELSPSQTAQRLNKDPMKVLIYVSDIRSTGL